MSVNGSVASDPMRCEAVVPFRDHSHGFWRLKRGRLPLSIADDWAQSQTLTVLFCDLYQCRPVSFQRRDLAAKTRNDNKQPAKPSTSHSQLPLPTKNEHIRDDDPSRHVSRQHSTWMSCSEDTLEQSLPAQRFDVWLGQTDDLDRRRVWTIRVAVSILANSRCLI